MQEINFVWNGRKIWQAPLRGGTRQRSFKPRSDLNTYYAQLRHFCQIFLGVEHKIDFRFVC